MSSPAPREPGRSGPARIQHSGLNLLRQRYWPVVVLLIALVLIFGSVTDAFLTTANLNSLISNSAILFIVCIGMTFVLLSGGFDLSVGAVAALAGIFLAKALPLEVPGILVLAACVLFGALLGGIVNGLLVGRAGLPVFVVTLATMIALSGVTNLWADSQPIYVTSSITRWLGTGKVANVPVPVLFMAAAFLLALYVQSRTYFGRDVYAVGGSATAARLAGIRTDRTLVAVYAISGACAALAGAIAVGRVGAAVPQVDATLPLQAIAAVLLGGTALGGGLGGVGGTVFGVLFIAVLENGLSLSGVSTDWQNVLTGVILMLAVAGDRFSLGPLRRRRKKGSPSGDVPGWTATKAPVTTTG